VRRTACLWCIGFFQAALAAGCGSSSAPVSSGDAGNTTNADDGRYHCVVVQIRSCDGCCQEPQPACGGADAATAAFDMQISGNTVSWVGCFSCTGSWSASDFACSVDAGVTCPPEPWVVLHADPVPSRPLNTGELYAGIPVNNAFNAHCARVGP
jgi:hypothetical protein